MSHGDSFDTFSGPAVTHGDGSKRYRALRIDRNQLATTHPAAIGVAAGDGAPIDVGHDDVRVAELLSRPEAVDLQVFVVEIEDDATYLALAERDAIVNYPVGHVALRISDWGDAHAEDVTSLLEQIAYDDGSGDADHEPGSDDLRRTSADREQAGRHAHHPARRQRAGSHGGWVG